jgi:UDP-N-acetylglucosamine 2-epimerase (non-hydrolysing)
VAHVEAGLRSFDREMPEEINRLLTDQISDLLFVSEASGVENLRREGIPDSRVFLVGNVMIDTLLANREAARALNLPAQMGLTPNEYGVLTLHRPSNVDNAAGLDVLFGGIREVARDVPLVFPVHPRTRRVLGEVPIVTEMVNEGRLRLLDPLGYLEFLGLMADARVVLTDSGGVQEETTTLGVLCLTLRDSTERPVTITEGTNRLVGSDPAKLVQAWRELKGSPPPKRVPALWDGGAAERIVAILREYAGGR